MGGSVKKVRKAYLVGKRIYFVAKHTKIGHLETPDGEPYVGFKVKWRW